MGENVFNSFGCPDQNWVKPDEPAKEKCKGCGLVELEWHYIEPVWLHKRIVGGNYFENTHYCQKCAEKNEKIEKEKLKIAYEKQKIESEKLNYQNRIEKSGLYPKHRNMLFTNLEGKEDDATKLCKQFCNKQDFNLFMWGGSGLKKTHLLAAIANQLVKTQEIRFYRIIDFLDKIREITITQNSVDANNFIKSLIESKIPILIDDIGAEKVTDFCLEKLYNFFDLMDLYEHKGIVITSNLNLNELSERLSDRITSRIAGLCRIIKITGTDFRLKRGTENG